MSLRKCKAEMETTDSSFVYKRARKRFLDNTGEISCSICPYHFGENSHKYQRNWKKTSKRRHQRKEN